MCTGTSVRFTGKCEELVFKILGYSSYVNATERTYILTYRLILVCL